MDELCRFPLTPLHILFLILLLFIALLPVRSSASTFSDTILDAGVSASGYPLAITPYGAMSYNWDGSPRSPVFWATLHDILPEQDCRELSGIYDQLNLKEEDRARVFLMPPSHDGAERLLASTVRDGSSYDSSIYSWPDLQPIADFSLNAMLKDLYGDTVDIPEQSELQLRSVARNPDGDLLMLVLLQTSNTWTTEFGVWTGSDWLPLQLPQHFDSAGRLSEFNKTGDYLALDRIYFGPAGEMLLCTANGYMHFYEPDPRTGAYILRQSYAMWDVNQHSSDARSALLQSAAVMGLVLILSAGSIAWFFLARRRRAA